ncbi:hypothetical protein [Chryseobacterium lineare]
MSKKKLLINEVFRKAKEESQRDTKNGLALYLWLYFKDDIGFEITDKSFSRYYDTYVMGNGEIRIQPDRLDRLSEYLGYKDFTDFSRTFVKKDEDTNKTTVKISVDHDEESLTEKLSKIIINITNEQHFKMPAFIKQNGLGILEMAFVILLATGGVVFPKAQKNSQDSNFSSGYLFFGKSDTDKKYMYWNGERYIATDSSYINPEFKVVAMNRNEFIHFRKIKRKDTMTIANSLGKVWCSKWNNEVDFFTMDGKNPDNGRELKMASDHMILKYAGRNTDSIYVEE